MSKDPNPVGIGYRRHQRLLLGFVLGAAIAAIVMGFLWSSDSARQLERIRELSVQMSEKDATIATLYSQLGAKKQEAGSSTSNNPPSGQNP